VSGNGECYKLVILAAVIVADLTKVFTIVAHVQFITHVTMWVFCPRTWWWHDRLLRDSTSSPHRLVINIFNVLFLIR